MPVLNRRMAAKLSQSNWRYDCSDLQFDGLCQDDEEKHMKEDWIGQRVWYPIDRVDYGEGVVISVDEDAGICKVLDDDDGHTYHGPLELVERIELDDSPAWSLF